MRWRQRRQCLKREGHRHLVDHRLSPSDKTLYANPKGTRWREYRFFRFRYHYAATKGLVRSGLPRKIIGLYCDLLSTCLVFVFVKPRKQTHVREGGIARCFLIDVVCILYVCVFVPIRNWRQEQKFGPRSRLQRPISSILRHNFRRSLSFPVS
jgi:hypothetical protein